MAAPSSSNQLLPLRGGFAPRASVAMWLIEASWRLQFTIVNGRLSVSPPAAVTAADRAFILAHRDELLACVRYVNQQAEAPC